MRIEAINETVNRKVEIVAIVAKLVTDVIASGDDEMMMVHRNHQIQVMMTTMEDSTDLLIGGVGNANVVTKGHNIIARDLRACVEVPERGPITIGIPRVIARMWMKMMSTKTITK